MKFVEFLKTSENQQEGQENISKVKQVIQDSLLHWFQIDYDFSSNMQSKCNLQ